MSMLHQPSRPDEPNFDAESFDKRSENRHDLGGDLRALLTEAIRIGALPAAAGEKLGAQSPPAPPASHDVAEAEAIVLAERAARRAIEAGTISNRRAAELVANPDPEKISKLELKTDRTQLSVRVAEVALACGMLDEDGAKDLLETPGLRERAALAGQLLSGMAELQARCERTVETLSASGKISRDDADLLLATASFEERKEILDRLGKAADDLGRLERAVSLGIISSEAAASLSRTAEGSAKTDAMEKIDLQLETAELRQAMANSVERTLERAVGRKIIGEERAGEFRKIEDVEERFKAVKYLHVLADLDEEMERSFANMGPIDLDAPPFDLLEFKKGKKGGTGRE